MKTFGVFWDIWDFAISVHLIRQVAWRWGSQWWNQWPSFSWLWVMRCWSSRFCGRWLIFHRETSSGHEAITCYNQGITPVRLWASAIWSGNDLEWHMLTCKHRKTCLYTCQKNDSMLHVSIIGWCIPVVVHTICIWCVGTCESCVCCCISCIIGTEIAVLSPSCGGCYSQLLSHKSTETSSWRWMSAGLGWSNKCKQVTTSNTHIYIFIIIYIYMGQT